MKETLTEYLEKQPLARFRKNKDRACVNVLLRKYPHLKEHKDVLIAFVGEYNSMDRLWRKILEEREDFGDSPQVKIVSNACCNKCGWLARNFRYCNDKDCECHK